MLFTNDGSFGEFGKKHKEETLDALAYGIGLKQRLTENELFLKMEKHRQVQNFPKGWQAGIVYILCGVGPGGKPYDRAPITAVSPFLDWVKAEKEYYDEIRKETPDALELKIYWIVGKSLGPIRTEELRELGSSNEA